MFIELPHIQLNVSTPRLPNYKYGKNTIEIAATGINPGSNTCSSIRKLHSTGFVNVVALCRTKQYFF